MSTLKKINIPDIGGATDVDVIEVFVNAGDAIEKEQSLITLEGDKATMEIPSPYAGRVKDIEIKVGDKVSEGSPILSVEVEEGGERKEEEKIEKEEEPVKKEKSIKKEPVKKEEVEKALPSTKAQDLAYASPAVRRIVREFDLDIKQIKATGRKGRVTKEDVQHYVKGELAKAKRSGLGIEPMPEIDFSKFGAIETKPLHKIKKLTGANVHRSWVTVPHVTQFGEADITELEKFRKEKKSEIENQGYKLTPLIFIMKALVKTLKAFPNFNSSLDSAGENLIYKKYFHLGVAVDTPNGLVVPVIRDVDAKSTLELAKELTEISQKAREKGLSTAEMAGSCFTISSLGGIGGTAFTPIVKAPDVAILGVSRTIIKPVYQDNQFVPRLMLPLSLSYDHRVVDGADGARFMVQLCHQLADVESLLL